MSTTPSTVVSSTIPNTPVIDPATGQMSWPWLKWFQNISQAVNNGLNIIGQFIGELSQTTKISGRGGDVGTITQNIDDAGIVTADGIDFVRPYLNKTTDHIADGTGSPLAGGKTAYQALVASGPIAGRALVFSGATWSPQQVSYSDVSGTPASPANTPVAAHQWLASYSSGTGVFSQTQPSFSDLSGTAIAAQLPALSAMSGSVTTGQLPANVPVVSFGTGAPSGGSTEGYLYFDTTAPPYHGYVYHSGAWEQFS